MSELLTPNTKIVHKRIASTAKALAAAAYEEMAKVNEFYAANPSMKGYVGRNWRHFIPFARQALTTILSKDYAYEIAMGSYTPKAVEQMKHEVYEALVIDGQMKRTRYQQPLH